MAVILFEMQGLSMFLNVGSICPGSTLHCGSGAGVRGTLDTLSARVRSWESPGWDPEKPFILISATVQGEVRQQWRLLEEFYLTPEGSGTWLTVFLNPLSIATRLAFKEILKQEDSICLLMVT